MDLQLTTAEAHIVRDALDEFVTTRTDSLRRADGSPGLPRYPESTAMRSATSGWERPRASRVVLIQPPSCLST